MGSQGRVLSPRQVRFKDFYLVDLNGTKAAIQAGYSEKTAAQQATRLLKNVQIIAAIEAAKADLAERTGRDQEWVLERLESVHDASMKETASGTAHNPAAANRSLELIGKHGGMWQEGREAGDINILINVHPHGNGDE